MSNENTRQDDSRRPLAGRIALVAGATRGAGRAQAVELGRAGATVYVTGRTTRTRASEVGRSTETIEETAELVDAAAWNRDRGPHRPPRRSPGTRPRRTDRPGAGPSRHPRQRPVGRRAPPRHLRVREEELGDATGRRPAHPGTRRPLARDHGCAAAAAADPFGRAAARGGHRRHRALQPAVPREHVLRPGEERSDPSCVRAGPRTGGVRGYGGRGFAGLPALGADAHLLRRQRGELARRDRPGAVIRDRRVPAVPGPDGGGAGRRPGPRRAVERQVHLQRGARQGVRGDRRGRQLYRTPGRTSRTSSTAGRKAPPRTTADPRLPRVPPPAGRPGRGPPGPPHARGSGCAGSAGPVPRRPRRAGPAGRRRRPRTRRAGRA